MNMECNSRITKISVFFLGGSLLIVILSYVVFGNMNEREDLKNLQMVSILFRHGHRTPTELYPKDPYINYEWQGGLGALTQKGSLQMYNLGKIVKSRYFMLLPKNSLYSKNEMYVQSSASERCQMSAQSFLAGFLPPLENQKILPIYWQPVAINMTKRLDDAILAQKKPCKIYNEILNDLYAKDTLNEENRELYELLTQYTGLNISNLLHAELVYNILEIEKSFGLNLPEWTKNIFPSKLLPLAEKSYSTFTKTSKMKKIKGGPFLTEVYNHMANKKQNYPKDERKIFLYSGHDTTLVNVMNSLNILGETSRKPDFASALVFELHKSDYFENDFEVKMLYYFNSEDKFPKEINLPKCNKPCSLNQFRLVIKELLVVNFDELCENPNHCK